MRVSCVDRRTFRVPIPTPRPAWCDPIDDTMFTVPAATVEVDRRRWIETEQEVRDDAVILTAECDLTPIETVAAMLALEIVLKEWVSGR
jgi:hypothetical protein